MSILRILIWWMNSLVKGAVDMAKINKSNPTYKIDKSYIHHENNTLLPFL